MPKRASDQLLHGQMKLDVHYQVIQKIDCMSISKYNPKKVPVDCFVFLVFLNQAKVSRLDKQSLTLKEKLGLYKRTENF